MAAAGAAVGAQAAASGPSITMPVASPLSPAAAAALGLDPKPQAVHSRLPETDAAIAAASAAAAAAVAAVSAAIAATAAANASKPAAEAAARGTVPEPARPALDSASEPPAPAVLVAAEVTTSLETQSNAVADGLASAELAPDTGVLADDLSAVAIPPTAPQFDPRNAPVTVTGYVRPPGRDVPGLIRAKRDWTEPAAEATSSTAMASAAQTEDETAAGTALAVVPKGRWARKSSATTPDPEAASGSEIPSTTESKASLYRKRLAAAAAGAAAALLAAGTAFGHRALPAAKSARSALRQRTLPAAKSAGSTLVHVVTVPVRLGNRLAPEAEATPVYDEYGTEQRRRRFAPGWLLFVGFYGMIFVAIGANMIFGPSSAEGAHPSMSAVIAAAHATSSPTLTAAPTPTPSAVIGVLTTDPPTVPPETPDAVASPTPTASPVATDMSTPPPTAAPTKKPTPKPTVRRTAAPPPPATPAPATPAAPTPVPPTPVPPTPVPTPSPTPVRNFAAFASSGTRITVGSTVYTATYTAPYHSTTGLTLILSGVGGATCTFARSGSTTWHPASTIPGTAPATNAIIVTPVGTTWNVGTYTITATCTLTGYADAKNTVNVTITP